MNPLPATSKIIHSDDRKKLQAGTKVPEARQLFQDHRTNAPIQLHCLAKNALHPPGKGSEQAGRNGLQLGDSSTPAAVSARFTPQLASTITWAHRVPYMHSHARDLPFGAGHEQAQPVMDPLAASTKKINSDVRNELQESTQVPATHQLFKYLGEQASDKINCLAGDAPLLPSADDYERGEPKLPGESSPHDTLGLDTLQSAEYTTKAKPRLPGRQGPTNMPARKGRDKQQPSPEEPILQKKFRLMARGGM